MSPANPVGPVGSSEITQSNREKQGGMELSSILNEQHISSTDWSRACFPIGVKTKSDAPWEGATRNDLRILAGLLLKPLTLVTPAGIVESPPLADASDFLKKLGQWAKGAAEWVKDNPDKVP